MSDSSFEDKIEVSVPSRLENLNWLYPICDSILSELPFDRKRRHMLLVAISEGFTNAFQHGNQKSPDTQIRLTFYVSEKSLKILIEDEAVLPIKSTDNLFTEYSDQESTSGRGLHMIGKIVDNLYFEHGLKGKNRLVLEINFADKREKANSFSGR